MSDECYRCGQPGHWASQCPERAAARSRVRPAPVESGAVPAPVSSGAPAPAQGSARPGNWKIPGITYRPSEDRSKDVPAQAEAARRGLERLGLVIDRPEYQSRRLRSLALEQLADCGRIGITEHKRRLADVLGVPTIPARTQGAEAAPGTTERIPA